VDGDDEPVVGKGEATRGVALDETRSTGAVRGRGGAQAAPMPKHRGERGRSCLSLSGRKGWVARVRHGVRSSEGGGDRRSTTRGDGRCGRRSGEQGRRAGVEGSSTVARGLARGDGKWAGPRETVPGGGGKLIRI
jgi:hypothetical protein